MAAELTEEQWSRLLDNINHENPAYERTRPGIKLIGRPLCVEISADWPNY
jgi:hypothetical protein